MTTKMTIFITVIGLLLISLIAALIVIYISFGRPGHNPIAEGPASRGTSALFEASATPTAAMQTPAYTSTWLETIIKPASTATVTPTSIPQAAAEPQPETESSVVPSSAPGAVYIETPAGICETEGVSSFLLVIEDSNTGNPPFGAELIRYIRVNDDDPRIVMFAFPRYLQLSTPDLDNTYGITELMLGSIYHAVYQRVATRQDAAEVATNGVGQAIYSNFDLIPDHFITLKRGSLEALMRLLGPLDVENKQAFSSGSFQFEEGTVTLDQNNIWEFAMHSNDPRDEFARIQRQDQFILSLFEEIKANVPPAELEAWVQSNTEWIISDMDEQTLVQKLCIIYEIPAADVAARTFPAESIRIENSVMLLNNPDEAQGIVDRSFSAPE